MISFISIDPSLRNTAIVWGEITGGKLLPTGYTLSITEKSKHKSVRAASDTVSRCRQTISKLQKIIEIVEPDICFCEVPSGSQSSSAMKSYGVSCALIALLDPPAIEVTPTDIKKVVNGTNQASKKEIIDFVEKLYPLFPYERKKDGTIVSTKMEHVCDAICAALAGMETTQYKQLETILNKIDYERQYEDKTVL